MIEIQTPTLILDKEKCLSNLQKMAGKAYASQVIFRPHFKTHQSAYIGNWFRKLGIHAITVSSVNMAKYFSNYGWRDITIAMPFNILESSEINELARNADVNILAESIETLKSLESHLVHGVGVYVEIDTGYKRSGIDWENLKKINSIVDFLKDATMLSFKGFLTHAGHTYHAGNVDEIKNIHQDSIRIMKYLKENYVEEWPSLRLSIGDTPSCSIADSFIDVDEIRPGNFIFYDLMQYSLGVCTMDEIAMVVACPVVAKNLSRNEIVIYGGAVHLSKEFLYTGSGDRIFGYVVKINEKGWSQPLPNTSLVNISQEHGIIEAPPDIVNEISRGDILGIIPVHACLAANLLREYQTLEGILIDY